MNRVIDGHKYDTETAKKIGSWDNGLYGDLYSVTETLYRTKSGYYFIHGEGGAGSCYSKMIENNSWTGSEDIIPMTAEASEEWAKEHLTADDYEKVFGEAEDDGVQISATISEELKSKLDKPLS